ncbi:DUF982 domain-containing protein [Ensifer sp. D2-11]
MDPGPWNECVPVRIPDDPQIHMVSNTRQAVELLTTRWPVSHGQAYRAAIDICMAVLERESPAYVARAAFVAAAKEAQVNIVS